MQATFGSTRIELIQGDITQEKTDAIVNAANSSLLGGGGVDGAIHRAGGPAILQECKQLGGCETGDAKLTSGGSLHARYVIHAVGPVYQGGEQGEDKLLARCYRRALEIAQEHHVKSISFPSISTGAYGYPVDEAASLALITVKETLPKTPSIHEVHFVLFDEKTFQTYKLALQSL